MGIDKIALKTIFAIVKKQIDDLSMDECGVSHSHKSTVKIRRRGEYSRQQADRNVQKHDVCGMAF